MRQLVSAPRTHRPASSCSRQLSEQQDLAARECHERQGCCGLESSLAPRSARPGVSLLGPHRTHGGLGLLLQAQIFSEPSGQNISGKARYYYYCYQRHCYGRWFYYTSYIASSDIYIHSLNCHKSDIRYSVILLIFSSVQFSSVQFSPSVMSDSLRPHESQHARPPCPSLTCGVHPNPCPLSW